VAGNVTGIVSTLPLASGTSILGDVQTQGIRGSINQIPQALSAVSDFVRGGETAKDAGLAARVGNQVLQSGKAAIVAAPVGALYGAGDADPGRRLQGAELGAGLAVAGSRALPVAGATIGGLVNTGKGIVARGADALESDGDQLYSVTGNLYNKMRAAGSFILTGNATTLVAAQKLSAATGIYTVRGHRREFPKTYAKPKRRFSRCAGPHFRTVGSGGRASIAGNRGPKLGL